MLRLESRNQKTLKMTSHEIDYHVYGEEMQYVEIELDPQGSGNCRGRKAF